MYRIVISLVDERFIRSGSGREPTKENLEERRKENQELDGCMEKELIKPKWELLL